MTMMKPGAFVPLHGAVPLKQLRACGLDLMIKPNATMRTGAEIEAPARINSNLRGILSFGAFSYINGPGNFANVHVGRYCSIAGQCDIGAAEHPTDWLGTSDFQYCKVPWMMDGLKQDWTRRKHEAFAETWIGHDVWLGRGAFVRGGVRIGTGAIVGARSVVVRDVAPYTVVAGNPARAIRRRFSDALCEALLETRWWDFSPPQLRGCPYDDAERAVALVRGLRARGVAPFDPVRLVVTPEGPTLVPPQAVP